MDLKNKLFSRRTPIIIISILLLASIMVSCTISENQKSGKAVTKTETNEKRVISSDSNNVTIIKDDITKKATFYSYQSGDTYMEVVAIRASDGTVRTAFNTCQICQGSGRAYFKQEGDVLVCQNCGNRFTVDQVEVIKGGCNPIPIFEDSKTDDGEIITIPGTYLDENKSLFTNWKS